MKNFDMNDIQQELSSFTEKVKQDKPYIKKIVIMAGAMVLLLGGTFAIGQYQAGAIQIASSKQEEYRNIQNFMTKYNKEASEYQSDIKKVSTKVVQQKDLDKASQIISKLAETNALTVSDNKKNEKVETVGNGIFAQSVTMTVSGEYGNIINFLNEMENSTFFVSTSTLNISANKPEKNKGENTVNTKIEYKIFFVKD